MKNINFEIRKNGERTILDVFVLHKHSFIIDEFTEFELITTIKEILEATWERKLEDWEYDELIMKVMEAYINM